MKREKKPAKECEYDCRRPLFVHSRYVSQFENMNVIIFIETKISQSCIAFFLSGMYVSCMFMLVAIESMDNKGGFLDFGFSTSDIELNHQVLYLTTKQYSAFSIHNIIINVNEIKFNWRNDRTHSFPSFSQIFTQKQTHRLEVRALGYFVVMRNITAKWWFLRE